MSRSEDEIATLRESRQHLVFASDADRECTVQCIENTFSLNEFGKERIRCLLDNRLDRELIGHLIAMMSYNIASLQKKNVELVQTNAELERKREEDEAAVQRLTDEVELHKQKNLEMSQLMSRCGLTRALQNFETLKVAMQLVREENGFEELSAAVKRVRADPCPSSSSPPSRPSSSSQCESPSPLASPSAYALPTVPAIPSPSLTGVAAATVTAQQLQFGIMAQQYQQSCQRLLEQHVLDCS